MSAETYNESGARALVAQTAAEVLLMTDRIRRRSAATGVDMDDEMATGLCELESTAKRALGYVAGEA